MWAGQEEARGKQASRRRTERGKPRTLSTVGPGPLARVNETSAGVVSRAGGLCNSSGPVRPQVPQLENEARPFRLSTHLCLLLCLVCVLEVDFCCFRCLPVGFAKVNAPGSQVCV